MIASRSQLYTEAGNPRLPERRGESGRTPIEAAKEAVQVIDLADLLCGPGRMRRAGARWVASCPLPDHEDATPSFYVFPDNRWWCFGCLRGGDVVDLAAAAWGYADGEMAMAAARLLVEYGHEIPQRPPAWYRRQQRQHTVRQRIRAARVEVLRRRLFRVAMLPLIKATTLDEREYRAEIVRAWEDFQSVPVEGLLDGYDHLGAV